ncbi:hypothetical protein Pmani_033132 [Petrolisthes manimaculis]|uniref:Uncharacterized protein n=1 Tax=Petrolisthes manimaculis TaxID=1843537 RepID=A0AAE1NRW3_9EUCA|nr:hypothetical protein Pmani_033132 [Petrolisthes manimaculis]
MMKVVVVMLLLQELVSADMTSIKSRKVVPVMPEKISRCELEKEELILPTLQVCASFCSLNNDCNLFCMNGTVCSLYNAKVSTWWSGVTPGITVSYDVCYTTWYLENNLTPFIALTTASAPLSIHRDKQFLANGFMCLNMDHFCYISQRVSFPYWRADLGAFRRVTLIIIITRPGTLSQFEMIEISLGNSSDYNNPLFASYTGPAPPMSNINFQPQNPVTGRYLQVQSKLPISTNMAMCDIQIFS